MNNLCYNNDMVKITEKNSIYNVYYDEYDMGIQFCKEDLEIEKVKEFRVNSTDYLVSLDENGELILTLK